MNCNAIDHFLNISTCSDKKRGCGVANVERKGEGNIDLFLLGGSSDVELETR